MDPEESLPRRSGDTLAVLAREDLDPLSVAELHARVAALEAEIARARLRIDRAINDRASAEGLFRR